MLCASSSLRNARISPLFRSVWIVCRVTPRSAAAPPGETSRPPYLSNRATSFGSPPSCFASGIVRRLSHSRRLAAQFLFKVGERGGDDRAPAVHDTNPSSPQLVFDHRPL